jgi:hypothetical protein
MAFDFRADGVARCGVEIQAGRRSRKHQSRSGSSALRKRVRFRLRLRVQRSEEEAHEGQNPGQVRRVSFHPVKGPRADSPSPSRLETLPLGRGTEGQCGRPISRLSRGPPHPLGLRAARCMQARFGPGDQVVCERHGLDCNHDARRRVLQARFELRTHRSASAFGDGRALSDRSHGDHAVGLRGVRHRRKLLAAARRIRAYRRASKTRDECDMGAGRRLLPMAREASAGRGRVGIGGTRHGRSNLSVGR